LDCTAANEGLPVGYAAQDDIFAESNSQPNEAFLARARMPLG
jgi:hypothetical protein